MTTSTCDYLDDYIDGSLSPERIEQFDAHLADCTDCRDALPRQERLDAMLDEAATCLEPVSYANRFMVWLRSERKYTVSPIHMGSVSLLRPSG